MYRRAAPWAALALVVAASAWLRVDLLRAGPDPDTDAWRHFAIARRVCDDPGDLRAHWVWLPLWHAAGCAATRLGLGIDALRWLSVACSVASSLLLAWLLRRHLAKRPAERPWMRPAEACIPFAAGALAALWPLTIPVGASAEPEALFTLLLLASSAAWELGWPVATGAALACAALLRYEAWPVLPVYLALWWRGDRSARGAASWALPGVAVAAWCALHAWRMGAWFWFLRENRRYIRDAWVSSGMAAHPPIGARYAPVWYALMVPARSIRVWVVAAVPGAWWLVGRAPRSFVATAGAVLATVTAVWVARANLGLYRHFAALVPAYAAMVAAGVAVSVAWLARRQRDGVARLAVGAALVAAGAHLAHTEVRREMRAARHIAERTLVSERRVAGRLRASAGPRTRVFCDVAAVEVLSGLPAWRFVRWNVADVRDFNLLVEAAQRGDVLVASTPGRAAHLREGVEVLAREARAVLLRRRAPAAVDPALLALPAAR